MLDYLNAQLGRHARDLCERARGHHLGRRTPSLELTNELVDRPRARECLAMVTVEREHIDHTCRMLLRLHPGDRDQ